MMKVLHVGEYAQGGVATYIQTLLHHPDYPDIEDYLICSEKNSEHHWCIPSERVRYYAYMRNLRHIPLAIKAIYRAIREIQPDVIYAHSTWAGFFVRLPLLIRKKPCRIIYNAHGWAFLRDTAEWKHRVYAWIERLLLLRTDKVINVSKYEYRAAVRYGLPAEKQVVIYSGISPEKQPIDSNVKLPAGKINLLFVGRFDPQKGLDILLKAMAECKRKDLHLTVIGDNVIGGTHIEKKNTENVTFLGWIPHDKLGSYYNACDAVIMPSRWEAFGLTAIEAMKYSKPVIVSNKGALPELVQDGINGYVINIHCFHFCKLNFNKERLMNMGENGLKRKEREFSSGNMIRQTIDEYE